METGTCGLHGTVHVSNVVISTERSTVCRGSVSDWNSQLCRGHSQLWLSLGGPCGTSTSRRLRADNSSLHRQGRLYSFCVV